MGSCWSAGCELVCLLDFCCNIVVKGSYVIMKLKELCCILYSVRVHVCVWTRLLSFQDGEATAT